MYRNPNNSQLDIYVFIPHLLGVNLNEVFIPFCRIYYFLSFLGLKNNQLQLELLKKVAIQQALFKFFLSFYN